MKRTIYIGILATLLILANTSYSEDKDFIVPREEVVVLID